MFRKSDNGTRDYFLSQIKFVNIINLINLNCCVEFFLIFCVNPLLHSVPN